MFKMNMSRLNIVFPVVLLGLLVGCSSAPKPDAIVRASSAKMASPFLSTPVSRVELLDLLFTSEFDVLDSRLNALHQAYWDNPRNDQAVEWAFDSFALALNNTEGMIDKWIKHNPGSLNARAARSLALTTKGRQKIGGDVYINDEVDTLFKAALKDIDYVIAAEPRFIPVYCTGIFIHQVSNLKQSVSNRFRRVEQFIDTGLKKNPYSSKLRACLIRTYRPRWGGSHRKMMDVARDSKKYRDRNPDLKKLYWEVTEDRGEMQLLSGRFSEAIETYNKAIKIGDHSSIYAGLSFVYLRLKDAKKAKEYALKAIELDPYDGEALQALIASSSKLAYDYSQKERKDLALIELDFVDAISPPDREFLASQAKIFTVLDEPHRAISSLERLTQFDEGTLDVWRHLSKLYEQIGKHFDADRACQKAHRIDSDILCKKGIEAI